MYLRHQLQDNFFGDNEIEIPEKYVNIFDELLEKTKRLRNAFFAMIDHKFPVFLVMNPKITIDNLRIIKTIRLFYDKHKKSSWRITDKNGNTLFSFVLPSEIMSLYSKNNELKPNKALKIKDKYFSRIILFTIQGKADNPIPSIIQLYLDRVWYKEVLEEYKLENDNDSNDVN